MARSVGLDVHKRVVEACVLEPSGRIQSRCRFPCTREEIERFARGYLSSSDRVALEATTNTWGVVSLLRPWVSEVVVSNPMRTKAIAEAKVKTDKVDAKTLGDLLRTDFLPNVWQPDEATLSLRRLTARRAGLVADRTAIKNRIHSVLHQRLIATPMDEIFGKVGMAWLRTVSLDKEGRTAIDSDLRLLETLEKEIGLLDEELSKKGYGDPRVKLLMTLPGVDVSVAMTLLSAWGDIERFSEADKAASYLGLVPRTKQSAEHCYNGPITKEGRSHARWMLVQAAHHLGKHPGPLGVFFRRLVQKKGHNVAIVATARKLAVIAWHMLKHNEPYRYATPETTQAKLSRLRVKATGQRRPRSPRAGRERQATPEGCGRVQRVPALPEVYQAEGLPPALEPKELKEAERRMLRRMKITGFVQEIQKPKIVILKKRTVQNDPQQDAEGTSPKGPDPSSGGA